MLVKVENNNDSASEGLNLSDPRHQLIYALRLRLATLKAAESAAQDQSTSNQQTENTQSEAGTAENQALTAGTPPEHSRNAAETPPEYSACSAGTSLSSSDVRPDSAPTDAPRFQPKRKVTESPLDELPADTQATILHLLETLTLDAAELEIVTKQPYGMGIETSRSSLYRFLQRHTKAKNIKSREQDAAETAKLIAEAKSSGNISHTATHLIALRLLETAIIENSNPSDLLALSKAIDRLNAIEHSERRLRLAEQKAKSATKRATENPSTTQCAN